MSFQKANPHYVQNIVNVSPIIQIQHRQLQTKVVVLPNSQQLRLFQTESGEWMTRSQIRKRRKKFAEENVRRYENMLNPKRNRAKKFIASTPIPPIGRHQDQRALNNKVCNFILRH